MNTITLFLKVLPLLKIRDSSLVQEYVDLVAFPSLFTTGKIHNHHVLPKSIARDAGISELVYNDPNINIVSLEIQDHIIAHYYLYRILGGKMTYAFHKLVKFIPEWESIVSSKKTTRFITKEISRAILECPNINAGCKMPEEMRQKMRDVARDRSLCFYKSWSDAGRVAWKGKKHSSEDIEKMRVSHLGKKGHLHTENELNKMRERHVGRIALVKDGYRRYVFKDSDDWHTLINDGWVRPSPSKYYTPKGRQERKAIMVICPSCGKLIDSCGLSAHKAMCEQEVAGILTTKRASKVTEIHECDFKKFGSQLFPDKELSSKGKPTFWTSDEINEIVEYVRKNKLITRRCGHDEI
jgi:hypothetical protein